MKKVIIRTSNGEALNRIMHKFAYESINWFLDDFEAHSYGDDWNSCVYTSGLHKGLSCVVTMKKAGTITAVIFNEKEG